MSDKNKSKLGNLNKVEKSIVAKHGPDQKEAANSSDDKDCKEEKSESGNK